MVPLKGWAHKTHPGGLLLGRSVPLNCYMWFLALFIAIVKAPRLHPPTSYKTYRKTFLKGLARGSVVPWKQSKTIDGLALLILRTKQVHRSIETTKEA